MTDEEEKKLCHRYRMTDPEKLREAEEMRRHPVIIKTIYEEGKAHD